MARAGFRGRAGSPRTDFSVPSKKRGGKFRKAGALVTGDFLGDAIVGDLAVDESNGHLWVCTSTATAAWQKVGLQT